MASGPLSTLLCGRLSRAVAGEQVQITPLQLFIALAITSIDLATCAKRRDQ